MRYNLTLLTAPMNVEYPQLKWRILMNASWGFFKGKIAEGTALLTTLFRPYYRILPSLQY